MGRVSALAFEPRWCWECRVGERPSWSVPEERLASAAGERDMEECERAVSAKDKERCKGEISVTWGKQSNERETIV